MFLHGAELAELIQFLDEKSFSLIMRDARDDGKKALEILRAHYAGSGKPRIISLYTELTSLIKHPNESVTDYVITVETASAALNSVGENVSDSLLIAMVLRGLPESFKPFVIVILILMSVLIVFPALLLLCCICITVLIVFVQLHY